jgi:hypothetical protein
MKCYMLRHQQAGILTDFVFAEVPTAEQLAPLLNDLRQRHGEGHWTRVHEATLVTTEIPVVSAGIPAPQISAAGTVTLPPKE